MKLTSSLIAIAVLVTASTASASESCTVLYRIAGAFQVTDTQFGKGDILAKGLNGSLVMEYPINRDGLVTDGKVHVLHFAMFEELRVETVVDVTSTVHHFAPSCNGERTPSWRRRDDCVGHPAGRPQTQAAQIPRSGLWQTTPRPMGPYPIATRVLSDVGAFEVQP